METAKPTYYHASSSVICTVSNLHSFFRDMQSYYKILQGQVLSELETVEEDEFKTQQIKTKLYEINRKIDYFHVLNNSISSVNVIMHSEAMIEEFKTSELKSL